MAACRFMPGQPSSTARRLLNSPAEWAVSPGKYSPAVASTANQAAISPALPASPFNQARMPDLVRSRAGRRRGETIQLRRGGWARICDSGYPVRQRRGAAHLVISSQNEAKDCNDVPLASRARSGTHRVDEALPTRRQESPSSTVQRSCPRIFVGNGQRSSEVPALPR